MTQPAVSVVLPVWNGGDYLQGSLDSILAQTFDNFEIVAVNDGSTDNSREILAGCNDTRLRVIDLAHSGLVTALNEGITAARATWIARMDHDDMAHPDRLAIQWAAVAREPECVLCYTDTELIDNNHLAPPPGRFPRTQALLTFFLCFQCPLTHSSVMLNREGFLTAGSYAQEDLHAEDFGLWGRLLPHGRTVACRQKLLTRRFRHNSVSRTYQKAQHAQAQRIAQLHAMRFLGLDESGASRAFATFHHNISCGHLRHWAWLIGRVLAIRPMSAELLAWLAIETARRIVRPRRSHQV